MIVLEDETREEDFGWIVFYNVEDYKKRDPNRPPAIVGNAPFIVTRADGRIHTMGTANPTEFYIQLFRRTGSTNPEGPAK